MAIPWAVAFFIGIFIRPIVQGFILGFYFIEIYTSLINKNIMEDMIKKITENSKKELTDD